MPSTTNPIRVAILDDYQQITESIFSSLKPQFELTAFPDTLLPYNHPSTTSIIKAQLVERLKPFPVISCMRERTPFPADLLKQLPNLKLLLTTGMRNRGIDLSAAKSLGITVTGATGKGRTDTSHKIVAKARRGPDSTTQHCVALILGIARCLASDDARVKSGGAWQTDFATGLSGKVFATLGLGRLGGTVAKIMYQSFGMRVICWSSSLNQATADAKAIEMGLPIVDEEHGEKVFQVVSKKELFAQADVLSVHYVLSERSRGLVGEVDLALMKSSAFLINTSRGPIVDENALIDVLDRGRIRGVALDVFEFEPLESESRWVERNGRKWGQDGRSRVLLSPHMGYVEDELMTAFYEEQVEILEHWAKDGSVLNVLN